MADVRLACVRCRLPRAMRGACGGRRRRGRSRLRFRSRETSVVPEVLYLAGSTTFTVRSVVCGCRLYGSGCSENRVLAGDRMLEYVLRWLVLVVVVAAAVDVGMMGGP